MSYCITRTLDAGIEEVRQRAVDALKRNGFGIITEIDLKEAFMSKIGVDFRDYRILGACNPAMAYKALEVEDKVGVMLPCNVVIQDVGDGRTEVAAVDPVASMRAIDNARLKSMAEDIRGRLSSAIEAL